MQIRFYVQYQSQWGQQLYITGNVANLGHNDFAKGYAMQYYNQQYWVAYVDIHTNEPFTLTYRYGMLQDGIISSTGKSYAIFIDPQNPSPITVADTWMPASDVRNPLSTKPFTDVYFNHPTNTITNGNGYTLRIVAPLLPSHQTVCVLGDTALLSNWNPTQPRLMEHVGDGWYSLHLPEQQPGFQYKYGVYDTAQQQFIQYENGENRTVPYVVNSDQHVVLHDGFIRLPTTPWHGAGIALPVFSARSEKGFGVGEFNDLPAMGLWAKQAGFNLLQLLPVNDTGATLSWRDSYPYAAISAFALHPLFVHLPAVGTLPAEHPLQQEYASQQQALNALPTVDYETVMRYKMAYLESYFQLNLQAILKDEGFNTWSQQNNHWLAAYAAFCSCRDEFGTANFYTWSHHNYQTYTQNSTSSLRARGMFYRFVQYQLHLQLQSATQQLHALGVTLKGDIAIGVHPHSADVWANPQLFHTNFQAGAPPDVFAVKGQNWGFPTYNWTAMAQDGYRWWKERLSLMAHYFDAYRIDHILGFFRIWQVPREQVEGILGYFEPAKAFSLVDFDDRFITFNRERFCTPYIDGKVLWEIFGEDVSAVKKQFLDEKYDGTFQLKPQVSTQSAIVEYAKAQKIQGPMLEGLLELAANVLFITAIDDKGVYSFHPRFQLMQTSSYKALDFSLQHKLALMHDEYFYTASDELWRLEALKKLPALQQATNMLVCAEDLGMIPACVPSVLQDLAILSLEIQRMPKALHAQYGHPAEAPYLSVVTTGTHDVDVLRQWWRDESLTNRQYFYSEILHHYGEAPTELNPGTIQLILQQHLQSPAMWCIFPLQDVLAMNAAYHVPDPQQERINIPVNSAHYWQYRMHVSLETLQNDPTFQANLLTLVKAAGRI
ncbi:4-alpha-glucanotransferase [Chitinophaga skermanii]|uniref:4-alpha-glucanotransferase n=1 Tax=Chitinophaga skermanii TaxID=331697 RepID=A0A327QP06_9BACT|nr:4-alpha-glucanotransferase [Chitinophaga skermanii]RAJ05073.1 4-alpha-glucanotransferase [Chitinophaga skermanii]